MNSRVLLVTSAALVVILGGTTLALRTGATNSSMQLLDWIQVGNLLIVTATLGALLWQTVLQNRMTRAQMLKDRWEMYWRLYEPITEEHVRTLEANPEDYVPMEKYLERYKDKPERIRRLIYMAQMYEYLVFLWSWKKLGVKDPLGENWLALWTGGLGLEEEFLDINEHYRAFYPEFAAFVDQQRKPATP